MDAAPSERSSSPTPSTRADLIRSFTTTSQTSADERIAAARAAREQRRREREREDAVVDEEEGGEGEGATNVPAVLVDEVESLAGDPETPPHTRTGSSNPSLVPRLRVKPTSDRSYTPSIPSTPSRSNPSSSSPGASPSALSPADAAPPASSPAPLTTPSTHARRSSFEVTEIPPFRPKTASPAPSPAPASSSVTPNPPPSAPSPARTPSPGVVLSGGLMERLKAQRAAKAAAEAKAAEEAAKEVSSPPPLSSSGATPEPLTTSTTSATTRPASTTTTVHSFGEEVTSRAVEQPEQPPSTAHAAPTSPTSSDFRSPLPASHPAAASPPTSPRSETSAFSRPVDPSARLLTGSPPRGRRTQSSKIYGRHGEEVEYDFTELSDVLEQSERSSLSTWRDSLRQHRRYDSASTTSRLPTSGSPTRPSFPLSSHPNRPLFSGTSGRQQADGSYSSTSNRRAILPSSASAKSFSSDHFTHGRSRSEVGSGAVDQRVDATAHLIGRSGSSRSIFSSSSSSRSSVASAAPPPLPPKDDSGSSPSRNPSPTRRISPEVARRAAQFGGASRPSSPVKPVQPVSPSLPPSPRKLTFALDGPSSASDRSASVQDLEDPLIAIERRRAQRRQDIESFRFKFGDTVVVDDASSKRSDRDRTWSEIEEKERKEAEEAFGSARASKVEKKQNVFDDWMSTRKSDRSGSSSVLRSQQSILCEGYLSVPPATSSDSLDYLTRPQDWVSRYCVLTPESLDFRPTDRDPHAPAVAACLVSDILCVEDEPDRPHLPAFRPFAVVLKDGERVWFACQRSVDRVRWLLALEDAIAAFQRSHGGLSSPPAALHARAVSPSKRKPMVAASDRSITPPGSFFSETRGTVRSWSRLHGEKKHSTPAALDQDEVVYEKEGGNGRFGHQRDLFGMYSGRVDEPSFPVKAASFRSTTSDRPLPPVPTRSPGNLPPLSSPTRSAFSHRRSATELSTYNTPHDQPPFRPVPTHPTPPPVRAGLDAFSPSSLLPARPSTRTGSSSFPSSRDDSTSSTKRYGATTVVTDEERRRRLAREEDELAKRLEARFEKLLDARFAPPPPHQQPKSPSFRTRTPSEVPDNATLTTRAGVHSKSEKLDWQRDLKRYKEEASFAKTAAPASSVASPNTMRHEREATARKLEGRSPLPVEKNRRDVPPPASSLADHIPPTRYFSHDPVRSNDPFAASGVVEPTIKSVRPTQDVEEPVQPATGRQKSITPSGHPYSEWSRAHSLDRHSLQGSEISMVEQTLWRILQDFDRQNNSLERNFQQGDLMAQVVGELAKWATEDREMRNKQFKELLGAVGGVVQHVSELPQRLLATLQAVEAGEPIPSTSSLPTTDTDATSEVDHEAAAVAAAVVDVLEAEEAAGGEAETTKDGKGGKKVGLNPLSSFAQLDRKLVTGVEGKGGAAAGGAKLKGPRMPGIRLWGAPEPVADRTTRWGGGAVASKEIRDKKEADEALADAAEKDKPPHGPIVEALKTDEKLGAGLQAIAEGEGTELDAGTLSLAVFEILQSMRELQNKQSVEEKKKAEERAANGGLTLAEKAELEAKKAEIARLEREMQMTADRTAHINELVAQLAQRTDKTDEMLAAIAKNVQEGKVTQMDPTLSDEVKKLLGGVRAGVDDHVKDFRGQLTSEVQRMFKEVGKLRDEKKALQTDIAELMAFQAKQGGVMPKAAAPPAADKAAPKPDKPADPPKPAGLPSSGFFGPRPMK